MPWSQKAEKPRRRGLERGPVDHRLAYAAVWLVVLDSPSVHPDITTAFATNPNDVFWNRATASARIFLGLGALVLSGVDSVFCRGRSDERVSHVILPSIRSFTAFLFSRGSAAPWEENKPNKPSQAPPAPQCTAFPNHSCSFVDIARHSQATPPPPPPPPPAGQLAQFRGQNGWVDNWDQPRCYSRSARRSRCNHFPRTAMPVKLQLT